MDSRCRAGLAIGLIETPVYTHAELSRWKSVFGTGVRMKSSKPRVCKRRLPVFSGDRSALVTPPMSRSASVFVSTSSASALSDAVSVGPTRETVQTRSSTKAFASGSSSVCASSSAKWCTTTPWSRNTWAKKSCSSRALSAHSTSSNNSSSQFPGVSRVSSSPGRCTIACRNWPTSESTPNMCVMTIDPSKVDVARSAKLRNPVEARPVDVWPEGQIPRA
jgi:hypothetical protein